jgi:uncharacterized repeat protein (TIGR01451 family)
MKKLLTMVFALIALGVLSHTSYAQKKQPGPRVPAPTPGYSLTVQAFSDAGCPAAVKNTSPWLPAGLRINCSSSGGPDCAEPNIPPGTVIRLSSAPLIPLGSWSLSGIPGPAVTPGTCGSANVDCEFKMPPHDAKVAVKLPCKPSGQATICVLKFEDKNGSGKQDPGELTLPGFTFHIKDATLGFVATITTGGLKKPCVTVPAPATYTVTEQILSPWTPTTPNPQTVTVLPGESPNLIFGNKKKDGNCDLTIGKSLAHMAIHPPFQTGQQVTFEIVVTNKGTGDCRAPTYVTDTFSAGLGYVSGGASGWVPSGGPTSPVTFTNNSLSLAPNQSSSFFVTYNVTGPPPDKITNCATVNNKNDTYPKNNTACLDEPLVSPCKDVTIDLSTGTGQSPWTVERPSTTIFGPAYSMTAANLPFPWVSLAGANWIQPWGSSSPHLEAGGFYTYRWQFSLGPPSQYSTISIDGQFAADNRVEFFLNLQQTGISCTPNCFASSNPLNISLPLPFQNGNNTLDAKVYNNPESGGLPTPTGLVVKATLRAICKKP